MIHDVDITVEDREGRPVLIAEVKAQGIAEDALHELLRVLDSAPDTVLFGMIVDPEVIRIFRRDFESPGGVLELDTTAILSHYSDDYPEAKARPGYMFIFHGYMTTLTTAWLKDLAYRWKGGDPPGIEELARVGLLERIEGGMPINQDLMRDRSPS
jgi:hypothetical protein